MKLLIRIICSAGGLMLIAYVLPGVHVTNVYTAIIASIVLGLLHAVLRPILILLTLPVTILTLGLFIFVINALLFMFAANLIGGFYVSGFISALMGSVLLSIINGLTHKLT
jgi:putative membrane protein